MHKETKSQIYFCFFAVPGFEAHFQNSQKIIHMKPTPLLSLLASNRTSSISYHFSIELLVRSCKASIGQSFISWIKPKPGTLGRHAPRIEFTTKRRDWLLGKVAIYFASAYNRVGHEPARSQCGVKVHRSPPLWASRRTIPLKSICDALCFAIASSSGE